MDEGVHRNNCFDIFSQVKKNKYRIYRGLQQKSLVIYFEISKAGKVGHCADFLSLIIFEVVMHASPKCIPFPLLLFFNNSWFENFHKKKSILKMRHITHTPCIKEPSGISASILFLLVISKKIFHEFQLSFLISVLLFCK